MKCNVLATSNSNTTEWLLESVPGLAEQFGSVCVYVEYVLQ